jgi:hypothetical protein
VKEEDAEAHEQRSIQWSWDERKGSVRRWGHLRADQGATVLAGLQCGKPARDHFFTVAPAQCGLWRKD